MGEIIYSWSSLVLRDLWGQPVQLLQFTNEKAETGEVRWLATPAQAPPAQRTWSSDFRDLFTGPLWSSPHCWLNDWACFLFHLLPCSLIEAGSWLFLLGSCLMYSCRKSHRDSSLTYTCGFAALSLPVASLPVWTHCSSFGRSLYLPKHTVFYDFCLCRSLSFGYSFSNFIFEHVPIIWPESC